MPRTASAAAVPRNGLSTVSPYRPPSLLRIGSLFPTAQLVQSSLQVSSSLGTGARRRRARRAVGSPLVQLPPPQGFRSGSTFPTSPPGGAHPGLNSTHRLHGAQLCQGCESGELIALPPGPLGVLGTFLSLPRYGVPHLKNCIHSSSDDTKFR